MKSLRWFPSKMTGLVSREGKELSLARPEPKGPVIIKQEKP